MNEQCNEYTKSVVAVAVASEKRKTCRLLNASKYYITKTRLDGCVFKQELTCDYLLSLYKSNDQENQTKAFFVELKGIDVKHAVDQIESTIAKMKLDKTVILEGRIISTSGIRPDLRPSNYLSLDIFLRKKGGKLLCRTNLLEETI